MEADDERLVQGFHGFEESGDIRWTDGCGVVPACLLEGFAGTIEITLRIEGTNHYIDDGEMGSAVA